MTETTGAPPTQTIDGTGTAKWTFSIRTASPQVCSMLAAMRCHAQQELLSVTLVDCASAAFSITSLRVGGRELSSGCDQELACHPCLAIGTTVCMWRRWPRSPVQSELRLSVQCLATTLGRAAQCVALQFRAGTVTRALVLVAAAADEHFINTSIASQSTPTCALLRVVADVHAGSAVAVDWGLPVLQCRSMHADATSSVFAAATAFAPLDVAALEHSARNRIYLRHPSYSSRAQHRRPRPSAAGPAAVRNACLWSPLSVAVPTCTTPWSQTRRAGTWRPAAQVMLGWQYVWCSGFVRATAAAVPLHRASCLWHSVNAAIRLALVIICADMDVVILRSWLRVDDLAYISRPQQQIIIGVVAEISFSGVVIRCAESTRSTLQQPGWCG